MDWQVGDLAVCVNRKRIHCGHTDIHNGDFLPEGNSALRVVAVGRARTYTGTAARCGCVELTLENGSAGVASRFRKIRPDEHEACEPEFVTLLKKSKKPAKVGGQL